MSDIVKQLEKLGLNSQQAQIYSLLIQRGKLRIQEISTLTEIPRSSVYDALAALSSKGLTERIIGDNHVKITAYPLDGLKHSLQQKIKTLETQSAEIDKLEKSLHELTANRLNDPTRVRYYRGLAGARQIFWNTLKAKDTVCVYSAWGRSKYIGAKFYENFVSESKQRQIKEKVLINASPEKLSQIKLSAASATSRTMIGNIRVLDNNKIPINGETFIYNNTYTVIYLQGGELNGFEIESQQFVEMQRSIFEYLWSDGKNATDSIS